MTSINVLHDVVLKAASECWFLYQLTTILFLHLIAPFLSVKFDERAQMYQNLCIHNTWFVLEHTEVRDELTSSWDCSFPSSVVGFVFSSCKVEGKTNQRIADIFVSSSQRNRRCKNKEEQMYTRSLAPNSNKKMHTIILKFLGNFFTYWYLPLENPRFHVLQFVDLKIR